MPVYLADHSPLRMLHRDSVSTLMAALLIGAATFGAAAVHADDELPGRVGRVADVGGELYLAPQDAPDQWNVIGQNYPVTTGDNLWVGNEGRAEIDFGGGQFRLGGATSLHVSRLDDRDFALFIAQGSVIVRVRVLEPGETARVDTPNAQAVLARPGLYRIEVTEDRQHTLVAVREGEALVDTGTAVQQVLPGQSATLDGATPQYALLRNGVTTDGLDTWSALRDRHYDHGRANAPVSRQMVGYSDLDENGTWDQAPDYGAVWYPANVAVDWAPYRNGYWTEVGAWGPTWVDAAPWGYAPFHYGRWAFIRGRWGWCPGGYVARPVWAPALVGWVGGPGWRVAGTVGAPVYGWVPLGWGEAYHPHWRGCSDGCWARFNKPYAVNVNVRNSAPPARYANWNAPGALSAVPGPVFAGRRPVAPNLVAVNGSALASAPVIAAPPIRPDLRQNTGIKPGTVVPPPASTAYAANPRQPRIAGPGSAPANPAPTVAVPVPQRPAPSWNETRARSPVVPPPRVPTYAPSNTLVPQGGGLAPRPVARTERVPIPASMAPAPTAPAVVYRPALASPAPRAVAPAPRVAVPAAQANVAPNGRPREAPKADKPAAPVVRVPGDAPPK